VLICIPDILTQEEVAHITATLSGAVWEDGRATAGVQSAMAKNNRQVRLDSPQGRDAGELILRRLATNPLFLSAALPKTIVPPLFNLYGPGETFGTHVDNAMRIIPQTGERIRTDLSATLFLAEPDSYEGGELVIETPFGGQEIKLPAGHMVLYPATSLHQVLPVSAGERLCSFFWMQSMVRDEGQRTMLFDLDQTVQQLAAETGSDHPHVVRLTGIYHNLIRAWGEP
jgi:PKHD-type hydroxylase